MMPPLKEGKIPIKLNGAVVLAGAADRKEDLSWQNNGFQAEKIPRKLL